MTEVAPSQTLYEASENGAPSLEDDEVFLESPLINEDDGFDDDNNDAGRYQEEKKESIFSPSMGRDSEGQVALSPVGKGNLHSHQQQQHPNASRQGKLAYSILQGQGQGQKTGQRRVSIDESENEGFRPSYEAFTPSIKPSTSSSNLARLRGEVKEEEHDDEGKRLESVISSHQSNNSSISRPDSVDFLRRASLVLVNHIATCETRFSKAKPSEYETGQFHVSQMESFSEENFVSPEFRMRFSRTPVARFGLSFSLLRQERSYHIPSEGEVFTFLSTLFHDARLSSECSIVCLIYVERLMKIGAVPLMARTWRPIVLCGLLLASKVWQDLACWNAEFSEIYRQFSLSSINKLERVFLHSIKWDLYISSSLYAKYYFALRSMTEKRDFRKKYNYMLQVQAPNASNVETRTDIVKNDFSHLLSRSL